MAKCVIKIRCKIVVKFEYKFSYRISKLSALAIQFFRYIFQLETFSRKSDSDQIIANVVEQLEDDCVLVQEDSNSELFELQQNSLAPILKWFNSEFSTNIAPSRNLLQTKASESDKLRVEAYLKTHSFETLMGLKFCMDTIKSVVLSLAAFKQLINCDSAVQLSRLEEEFQVSKWGSVEWAHDWSRLDTLTRFSAGILFATHCSELHFYK